jgi:hypothetical protein
LKLAAGPEQFSTYASATLAQPLQLFLLVLQIDKLRALRFIFRRAAPQEAYTKALLEQKQFPFQNYRIWL